MDFSQYFDYAAATPLLPEAKAAMQPYLEADFYNASALYAGGRNNRAVLEAARHQIAQTLGAKPTEIIFTAGGTEANNLAIHGIMAAYPTAKIIVSAIEHESVLEPAVRYDHNLAPVSANGIVVIEQLTGLITDDVALISIMYANNEVGSIQPLRDITHLVQEIRLDRKKRGIDLPLFVHTDACQAGNYLDMQVARLGVDLLTINAGKVYGPKQTGALYVRSGVVLKSLLQGGGQEWNVRSGTENLANIKGFEAAWLATRSVHKDEFHRLSILRDKAIHTFEQQISGIVINGATHQKRLANNVHLTIPSFDNERLLMELDEQGFQVATGSACSASNDEPSHVLKAMGLTDEQAQSSIRISLGKYTTQESMDALIAAIKKLVA
jgi:cysteine desulfurase